MCTVKVANKHALALEIVLRLSNVLAEVIVVAVTWRVTFISAKQISDFRRWRTNAPLTSMLLRDGMHASCWLLLVCLGFFQDLYTLGIHSLKRCFKDVHLTHCSVSLLLSLNIAASALWAKTVSCIK